MKNLRMMWLMFCVIYLLSYAVTNALSDRKKANKQRRTTEITTELSVEETNDTPQQQDLPSTSTSSSILRTKYTEVQRTESIIDKDRHSSKDTMWDRNSRNSHGKNKQETKTKLVSSSSEETATADLVPTDQVVPNKSSRSSGETRFEEITERKRSTRSKHVTRLTEKPNHRHRTVTPRSNHQGDESWNRSTSLRSTAMSFTVSRMKPIPVTPRSVKGRTTPTMTPATTIFLTSTESDNASRLKTHSVPSPDQADATECTSSCDMLHCVPVEAERCDGRVIKDKCNCCPVCVIESAVNDKKEDFGSRKPPVSNACDGMVCAKNKVCILNIQGIPMCRCPNIYSCRNADRNLLCSVEGVTYKNKCFLKADECSTERKIRVAHQGPCRTAPAKGGASSTAELSSLKQTNLASADYSGSQFQATKRKGRETAKTWKERPQHDRTKSAERKRWRKRTTNKQ